MTVSLVTGGAGFIGSHVADHLLKMGHKVVVMDDLSGGNANNLPHANGSLLVEHCGDSITDADAVNDLFNEHRFDYVFHLAAYAAESLSPHIRRFNYTNNLIGSVNLINAAVNADTVKRFVFTSSAAVYGISAIEAKEEQVPTPADPYGVAKYAVEMDLMLAARSFGLGYTIFRPHNVYGPRQSLYDGYRNVIGIFMHQYLMEQPMTIFGSGKQLRQFSYIDDVAPYIAESVNMDAARNHIINIGSDAEYSVNDLAVLVYEALGGKMPIPDATYLPDRHEAYVVRVDHDKSRYIFGSRNRIPLIDGLSRMAAWAKTQTLRPPTPFADIEIEKGLPPSWKELSK